MTGDTEVCWVRLTGVHRTDIKHDSDGHALFRADAPLKLLMDRIRKEYYMTIGLPVESPPPLGIGLRLV